MNNADNKTIIAVVGLGYVGMPLALAFDQSGFETIGFDVNAKRVEELRSHKDHTGETDLAELAKSKIHFSSDPKVLKRSNFVIVAVPTPIDNANQPDLAMLRSASALVGANLQKGAVVVFESTVYPGATEEVCGPVIEKESGYKIGKDFKIGYSPERINPGDKEHSLFSIVKVVSGMDKQSTKHIASIYSEVCRAGIYVAPNIKTAEAAKVIENTQRDLNIALINELSLIFNRLGIKTNEVLEAAKTKWNFLPFTPGLVGGHCIGVDPYYLVYKSEVAGYHPYLISAGRRINDYMPEYVAELTLNALIETKRSINNMNVLVMGLTFKENVPDTRNSKIKLTIDKLKSYHINIDGLDPHVTDKEIKAQFGVNPVKNINLNYDAIILATPHDAFDKHRDDLISKTDKPLVIIDVKNKWKHLDNQKGIIYRSL